jgi:hypothetical protein
MVFKISVTKLYTLILPQLINTENSMCVYSQLECSVWAHDWHLSCFVFPDRKPQLIKQGRQDGGHKIQSSRSVSPADSCYKSPQTEVPTLQCLKAERNLLDTHCLENLIFSNVVFLICSMAYVTVTATVKGKGKGHPTTSHEES